MKEVIKYLKLDWNTILTSSKGKKSLVELLSFCQTFFFSYCPDFVKNLFRKLQTINHFFFAGTQKMLKMWVKVTIFRISIFTFFLIFLIS